MEKKICSASAQQNQIEAQAMNAVLNVKKDRGFLLEFPRMRPAARRLILALDKATGQHDMVREDGLSCRHGVKPPLTHSLYLTFPLQTFMSRLFLFLFFFPFHITF